MSARLRLAPPAPRRAPAGGPRSTKKPIPLFARRAPSGHRAPQKAPSVPTAAPRRAAGWGGAKGEAVEGVSGDAERGGRRAARTQSLASRSARAAISRSTSATRPFCAAVWSSVFGIAPRREPALARLPARSPPPARAAQAPRLCSPAQPVLRPRAAPQLPRPPAKREPPPPRIPALQSTRAHTQPRTCAVLRAPPGSLALPTPRLLLLFSRSPGAPPRARVTRVFLRRRALVCSRIQSTSTFSVAESSALRFVPALRFVRTPRAGAQRRGTGRRGSDPACCNG